MTRKTASLALFALFLLCPSFAQAAPGDGVEWHKDFAAAREIARRTGKPMLVDFVADWCKPCVEMSQVFWPRRDIVELSKKFVCVKLNFDDRGPELSRFRVDRIPAVVFADSWGNPLSTKIGFGFGNRDEVLPRMMQAVPPDFSPLNDWNATLERDKNNVAALTGVARFYRESGLLDVSNTFLERALKTKELASDLKTREGILIEVGINQLKLKEYDEARKTFEQCLKEVPDGTRGDTALLGVLTAQLNKKKFADAEKTFERLKSGHPNSPAVGQAEQLLQQARSLKK